MHYIKYHQSHSIRVSHASAEGPCCHITVKKHKASVDTRMLTLKIKFRLTIICLTLKPK